MFQNKAEEAAQSFLHLLNNLPDAVILLSREKTAMFQNHLSDDWGIDQSKDVQAYKLHYCNEKADKLFKTKLCSADQSDLGASSYLMLENRCLIQMPENTTILENAKFLLKKEQNLTNESVNTLET